MRSNRGRRPAGRFDRLEARDLLAVVIEGPFFGTEGQSVPTAASPVVATFKVTDLVPSTSGYSAEIFWGDGSSTAGTVVAEAGGINYEVLGSHQYNQISDPTFPVNVVVFGALGSSIQAAQPGEATITTPLAATGSNLTETVGVPFAMTVAKFQDADQNAASQPGAFTAEVNWGDGTTSGPEDVTVSSAGGNAYTYNVTASHAYAATGVYATTITIDEGDSGAFGVANGVIGVTGVTPALTPLPQIIPGAAGMAVSPPTVDGAFTVNTFTPTTPFQASINWGDGQTSDVVATPVLGTTSTYDVDGTHTYTAPGAYPVTISVADGSGHSTVIHSTADITGGVPSVQGQTFTFTPGVPDKATVATFTDPNPLANASNTTAFITWGDGHTSAGTISGPDTNGLYAVTGTNTYSGSSPTYKVSVTITDPSGVPAVGTATAVATLPYVQVTALPISFVPREAFSGPVATFTDSDPLASASNTLAVLYWGDGTTTAGTISGPNASGVFTVSGSHIYTGTASTMFGVEVIDPAVVPSATGAGTAIATPSSVQVAALPVSFVPGEPFSGALATFTDSDPDANSSNTTAMIYWGDGAVTSGVISPGNSAGVFTVSETHTYASTASTTRFAVTIHDPTGILSSATGTAVAASVALPVAAIPIAYIPGEPFSGALATFTDPDPLATASNTTAILYWGDGTTTAGSVSGPSTAGVFTVSGTHAYASSTSTEFGVKVTDTNGASGAAAGPAVPTPVSVQATGLDIAATPGLAFSGAVATFTDSNPDAATSPPTALINWGDGTTTAGTISGPDSAGDFVVSGSHIYALAGTITVGVTIQDVSGATGTASSMAQVGVVATEPPTAGTAGLSTGGTASSTDRPTFTGKTVPFAIVSLTATPVGVDAPTPLGQTIADADGNWSLLTGPLAQGLYTVTEGVTPSTGSPLAAATVGGPGATIAIDTTPPKVIGVSWNSALGQVDVTFRDDLSGFFTVGPNGAMQTTLTDAAAYTLAGPGIVPYHPSPSAIALLPSGGLATDPQTVAIGIPNGERSHVRSVRIAAAMITDAAGNPLASDFQGVIGATTVGRASRNVVAGVHPHAPAVRRRS